jgi:hypothetical protein
MAVGNLFGKGNRFWFGGFGREGTRRHDMAAKQSRVESEETRTDEEGVGGMVFYFTVWNDESRPSLLFWSHMCTSICKLFTIFLQHITRVSATKSVSR